MDNAKVFLSPLIDENDTELVREEGQKEQEINESKHFCPLCAKYVDKKIIKNVQTGPVLLIICKNCDRILHNLNIILGRAREKINKDQEKIEKNSSLIIKPKPSWRC